MTGCTAPQQQLACQAQQIAKCLNCNQTLIMAALISYVAQWANIPVDCNTLNANAAQFACIPRQNQLSALLWLFSQLTSTGQINPQMFSGVGSPVGTITPLANTAMYADVTNPNQPVFWLWQNSTWTEAIG